MNCHTGLDPVTFSIFLFVKDTAASQTLANLFMLSKQQSPSQLAFYNTFEEQLSHSHPLYILANQINWESFEKVFLKLYSEQGHHALRANYLSITK